METINVMEDIEKSYSVLQKINADRFTISSQFTKCCSIKTMLEEYGFLSQANRYKVAIDIISDNFSDDDKLKDLLTLVKKLKRQRVRDLELAAIIKNELAKCIRQIEKFEERKHFDLVKKYQDIVDTTKNKLQDKNQSFEFIAEQMRENKIQRIKDENISLSYFHNDNARLNIAQEEKYKEEQKIVCKFISRLKRAKVIEAGLLQSRFNPDDYSLMTVGKAVNKLIKDQSFHTKNYILDEATKYIRYSYSMLDRKDDLVEIERLVKQLTIAKLFNILRQNPPYGIEDS